MSLTKTAPKARKKAQAAAAARVPELIFGDLWEFDPAPESADPKIKPQYELFIGGKFVAPDSGKYFDSINPATEKKLARIAVANTHDVDRAYKAAQSAFDSTWRKMPGKERGKYVYRIARLIQDARASSRWPRRWTAGSRSRSRATSTCPWRPRTSSITRAGPTRSSTRYPGAPPSRSASLAR